MKKIIVSTIILLCFLTESTMGSDCNEVSKYDLYKLSDAVFLAEIIETNSNNISLIIVHEKFKGEPQDTLLIKFYYSHYHTKKNNLWLIYSNNIEQDTLTVESCSGSKSFEYPYNIHDDTPYLMPSSIKNEELIGIADLLLNASSSNELYFDILNLRQLRIKNDLSIYHNNYTNLKEQYLEINNQYSTLIKILIVMSIVLILFGITLFKRKS